MVGRKRLLLVTGLWAMLAIGVATAIVGPSLPALAQVFELSWGQAGRVFAAQFGGKLLAVLIIWVFGRRWAAGGIAAVGGILLALGLRLVGLTPSFGAALVAMLTFGLGHGSVDVGYNSLLTEMLQSEQGGQNTAASELNVLHLFFGVGALSGPVLVSLLQSRTGSWRGAFLVAALCAGLVPLGLLVARGWRWQKGNPKTTTSQFSGVGAGSTIYLAMAICFLYGGLETALGGWIYTFLVRRAAFGAKLAAMGVTLYWSLLTAGRLVSAWGVRRLGDLTWLLISGGVLCTSLVIGLMAGGNMGVMTVALTGLGLSGIFPTMVGWTASRVRGSATESVSKLIATSSLGAVTIPWLVGLWVDWQGIAPAFVGLSALALLLEALLGLTARMDRLGMGPQVPHLRKPKGA
jgi:fucose permease